MHRLLGVILASTRILFAQLSITQFDHGLSPGASPSAVTLGPDGACWFVEASTTRIGRMTSAGAITEYAIPNPALTIAAGPDGAIWFTESGGKIARMTISGVVTNEFDTGGSPYGITL